VGFSPPACGCSISFRLAGPFRVPAPLTRFGLDFESEVTQHWPVWGRMGLGLLFPFLWPIRPYSFTHNSKRSDENKCLRIRTRSSGGR
jgi:hypothetical protein